MIRKLAFFGLLAITAGLLAWQPLARSLAPDTGLPPVADNPMPPPGQAPRIEAVFVLDTTGSMSGLLQAAKDKIWSIAATMAAGQPAPEIRIGIVAYRDRGDAYVTRVTDLSADLDSIHATLLQLTAGGGGDTPESVNAALHDALHRISWSRGAGVYRTIFLVGDAPAHMDYQDEVPWQRTLADARQAGIVVNSVQCGDAPDTRRDWRAIAQHGQGRYFEVDAAGGALAMSTPFDARIAELSAALDATRLAWGDAMEQAHAQAKAAATETLHATASVAARARRGAFNVSASGLANLLGDKDLVEDVASGRVELADIDREQLPAALAAAPIDAIRQTVDATQARRAALKREIQTLAGQRTAYIESRLDGADVEHSLDAQLFETVKSQATSAGLSYDDAAASY